MRVATINVVVVLCWCCLRIFALPDQIVIGGIFDSRDEQQALAFRYAVERVNTYNSLLPRSHLVASIVNLTSDDSFHAEKEVCHLMRGGVAAIFGPQSENSANHVQSICDAMEIPHIETRWHYQEQREAYSMNLHPYPATLGQAYREILLRLGWRKFVILYDTNESLVRVQSLLKEDSWTFIVRKLDESGDYRSMLKKIKYTNMNNFVVDVAKEKIWDVLYQAALVGLMTDYQRYFITNLDFNQVNLDAFSVGGPNITGVQLMDPHQPSVVEMVDQWRAREMRFGRHLPNFKTLSTEAALIYDAVILFASALTELDSSGQVDVMKLHCESDTTWHHGNSLINYMKWYSSHPNPLHGAPGHPMHSLPPLPPPPPYNQWSVSSGGLRGRARGGYYSRGRHPLNSRIPPPGAMNMSRVERINVMGLTGLLKFNEEGFRTDFQLDILEMDQGRLKKVGTWNRKTGANFTRTWAETVETIELNLRNKTIVVCTALTPPYTMQRESSVMLTGNDRYEGFCIDLVDQISKGLGFNYTVMLSPDGAYGSKNNATGEWDGIIKQLLEHKADIGIVDFTITYEREEAVDFTMPFMNLGISIIYTKPTKKSPSLFSFMSPFSVDVWIYMATAYLGVSVLLFILARMAPDEWDCPYPCIEEPEELENSFTLLNSMWFIIGTFLCQGADIAPKAVSTRIVAGIWWFFTLIMISSYTANLAAFLTVERMDSPIESAEDLAKQTKIKYGCKTGGSTSSFFEESTIPTYKKMWNSMSSARPSVFTPTNDQGVERVKKSQGLYAFLMESVSIEYVIERNCDLMQIGGLLDSKSYGIALPPESPYTGLFSAEILRLKEAGVLHRLKDKWWKEGGGTCQKEEEKDAASAAELGLENVGGVFVVMVGGIALACLTACCEFMWKARKLATNDGVSFGEELCKELLFVINCRENSKPVRKTATLPDHSESSLYGSSNYGYSDKN